MHCVRMPAFPPLPAIVTGRVFIPCRIECVHVEEPRASAYSLLALPSYLNRSQHTTSVEASKLNRRYDLFVSSWPSWSSPLKTINIQHSSIAAIKKAVDSGLHSKKTEHGGPRGCLSSGLFHQNDISTETSFSYRMWTNCSLPWNK